MSEPNRFLKSCHLEHPDNDEPKPLTFVVQDQGDFAAHKHVYMMWPNGELTTDDGTLLPISQFVQLYGMSGGYRFYHPVVRVESHHPQRVRSWPVGVYTRAQRDCIIELAKKVDFNMKSKVNNCQVWSSKLFLDMISAGLMPRSVFNTIKAECPLRDEAEEI